MTMTLISTITANGSSQIIDFTSIPQIYTDLMLVYSARQATGQEAIGEVYFNGLTTNLSSRVLAGGGSSAVFITTANIPTVVSYSLDTASVFGSTTMYIPNYTSTTNAKSVSVETVSENNAQAAYQRIIAGLWNSTAAINQISIKSITGNWAQYSTASLYGIKRQSAIGKPKALGGNITFADGCWVHTFNASGTFTMLEPLPAVEVLALGGGGGGAAGGGGAGGHATGYGSAMTARSYTITVGGGGAFSTNGSRGANGTSSLTQGLVVNGALGGGGGGGYDATSPNHTGAIGASGGGGGWQLNTSGTSAGGNRQLAGTGYAGGSGYYLVGNYVSGGGGGGFGGVGGNGSNSTPGAGGAGIYNDITGVNVMYSQGGRGWGDEAGQSQRTPFGANSGSGGHSGYYDTTFGGRPAQNGSSGAVIIKYPA